MVPEISTTTGRFFLSSWAIFYPFTPLTPQKNEKRKKKTLEISSFYSNVPKIMIICYTVPEIWYLKLGFFFPFSPPPPPHLPNSPKNQNFKKWKEKKSLEILSFYTYVPKIMIRWCTVPEIWCTADVLTDGRTDGRTEKVIYRGGCPPKNPNYLAQELVNSSRWKYFICF